MPLYHLLSIRIMPVAAAGGVELSMIVVCSKSEWITHLSVFLMPALPAMRTGNDCATNEIKFFFQQLRHNARPLPLDRGDVTPRPNRENALYQSAVELWSTCNVFIKGHR